jgi:hypothetical protein
MSQSLAEQGMSEHDILREYVYALGWRTGVLHEDEDAPELEDLTEQIDAQLRILCRADRRTIAAASALTLAALRNRLTDDEEDDDHGPDEDIRFIAQRVDELRLRVSSLADDSEIYADCIEEMHAALFPAVHADEPSVFEMGEAIRCAVRAGLVCTAESPTTVDPWDTPEDAERVAIQLEPASRWVRMRRPQL